MYVKNCRPAHAHGNYGRKYCVIRLEVHHAATGATGCDGVRKSVKFELAKTPFTVQFSGVENGSVGVVISRE